MKTRLASLKPESSNVTNTETISLLRGYYNTALYVLYVCMFVCITCTTYAIILVPPLIGHFIPILHTVSVNVLLVCLDFADTIKEKEEEEKKREEKEETDKVCN